MEVIVTFLPFIIIIGIMWLTIIRPQQKQSKQRQAMLDQLRPGQYVITIGGLHGILDSVDTAAKTVILDCDGVYFKYNLSAIAQVKETSGTQGTSAAESSTVAVKEQPAVEVS